MYLKHLSLRNFKNYRELEIDFSEGINFITGKNASGKTNILDAIFLLSFSKSYFNINDSHLINTKSEENFYYIEGVYKYDNGIETIKAIFEKGKRKTLKRNDKEYDKLVNHIGLIPLTIITPNDTTLISEGSEIRRKFLDLLISQFDSEYLYSLINYNKALKHRNTLLKQMASNNFFDAKILKPWTDKLNDYGTIIYQKRKEITLQLIELFNAFYYKIAEDNYQISIEYKSQLNDMPLSELLKNSIEEDKILQYTTKGIHKDDLIFSINGMKLKKIASQGQQKTLLIALKLAEEKIIEQESGKKPILLLDDVFDKLDETRVEKMLKELSNSHSGQIFITDTHPSRMKEIKNKIGTPSVLYEIENGKIKTNQ
jgi:DNA replication and repair protein RecF